MTTALLQPGPLMPALETRLAAAYQVSRLRDHADPIAFLKAEGSRIEAIACSSAIGFSPDLLPHLPSLKVVSNFGVGTDKLPLTELKARGIAVSTTAGTLDNCVADAAWALMLGVARRVPQADAYVRSGQWAADGLNRFPLGRRVSGARLGLIGLGNIGRVIAKRASGFDMTVAYHARRAVPDVPWAHVPKLVDLARDSDFLVVITSGGPETRHLVNGDVLDALGMKGFLINVARGSVVDEAALLQRLQDGRIGGAALDVFETEPNLSEAMLKAPRTVLMPHVASGTEETRQAMADLVVENLDAFFREGRVKTPV